MPLALYIHWPFCKKKCPYCDFNSHVRAEIDHSMWRDALLSELRHMHAISALQEPLTSIFFGGGTPSLMHPSTAEALIEASENWFGHHPDIEITLEANPTSVEAHTFAAFRTAGINRVSLGIQSLRQESLSFLGREHTAKEALQALESAQRHFARTNFDLIYALPHHTLENWQVELNEALSYARDHVSLYQLTIEPNTAFHHAYHVKQSFCLPEESLAADLYLLTQERMEAASMPAYEISNHARPGEASRHNLSYWRGDAYIGIGPGAHGRMPMSADSDHRYATQTYKTPELWLDKVARHGHGMETCQRLSTEESMEERVLTGLRLREGLALNTLPAAQYHTLCTQISPAKLDTLLQEGYLEISSNTGVNSPFDRSATWRTTARGRLVLNSLLDSLLA